MRLIPHIIDERARSIPDRTAFRSPRSSDPKDGWESVTWAQFANAVNHTARWLTDKLGDGGGGGGSARKEGEFPTIAYIGPNDARYPILVIAAVKAGYKALFVSPRNTLEGQLSLFQATACDTLLFAAPMRKLVQPWLDARVSMRSFEVSPLPEWFPEEKAPDLPFGKTYAEARWDPLVVLHTSGSTGIPKPVVTPHGMIGVSQDMYDLPKFQGSTFFGKKLAEDVTKALFSPMPFFHGAGILFYFMAVAYWDLPYVLGLPDRPLTPDLAAECIKCVGADAALLPPAIIEQMAQKEEQIATLKHLKHLMFGGGPLASECGNILVRKGVRLMNVIASTEFAPYLTYHQSNLDLWQYYIFNEELMGIDWRPVATGAGSSSSISNTTDHKGDTTTTPTVEAYQMIIRRKNPNRDAPGFQGWFYTFPSADEYDTKDLFERHPTLPYHWRYVGRGDDIIVFSNGEKLNPVTIEDMITSHPAVAGALVVGAGRFQAGLLIEPKRPAHSDDTDNDNNFIEKIWPLVQRANKQTVAHGRITSRDMIMISKPDKPFARAGKGTIQRAATVKLYTQEIDEMFRQADSRGDVNAPNQSDSATSADAEVIKLDLSSEHALISSIVRVFGKLVPDQELEPDTDLFTVGVDSLMVLTATRQLRAALAGTDRGATDGRDGGTKADVLNPRVVYANPTPKTLAKHIITTFGTKNSTEDSKTADSTAREQESDTIKLMQELLDRFTADLPSSSPKNKKSAAKQNQTILLTGSTGMLGGFILENLLAHPQVGKVICLNRAADGGKTKHANLQRGTSRKLEERSNTEPEKGQDSKFLPLTEGEADAVRVGSHGEDNEQSHNHHELEPNGTTTASVAGKVEFHHIDAAKPRLGLPDATYDRLLSETDRIIHNAWPVNFNIPLSSFVPSLQGVRNLTDLATAAEKQVVMVFVSSIGSVQGYSSIFSSSPSPAASSSQNDKGNHHVIVPETRTTDFRAAIPAGGYGLSKMLGSLIVDAAAQSGGFTGASVRVGQIAGSERASLHSPDSDEVVVWNRHEWLPSLIASSVALGALPQSLGPSMDRVDWTPVERVAGLIVDIAGVGADSDGEGGYYHGVNPRATTWSGDLMQVVQEYYRIPRVVGISEWVDLLLQSQKELESITDEAEVERRLARNPGLKLLDTYRGMLASSEDKPPVVLAMDKTAARSETIRSAGPITTEMMRAWCAQWKFGDEKEHRSPASRK